MPAEPRSPFDSMRKTDYSRLDRLGHVYLDYTGGGLYAESQLRRHHELLAGGVLGNPHSHNPTSLASTALVDGARECGACASSAQRPTEYEVIFTPTRAARSSSWASRTPSAQAAPTCSLRQPQLGERHARVRAPPGRVRHVRACAQTRSCGSMSDSSRERCRSRLPRATTSVRLPGAVQLQRCPAPARVGRPAHDQGWDVVLDCAAFAPTNRLDLTVIKPDFVPLSFYKMFGYPTGAGALLARREALASWGGPGSPAGPSRWRRCRARDGITWHPAPPASRTAPSTTWACPR